MNGFRQAVYMKAVKLHAFFKSSLAARFGFDSDVDGGNYSLDLMGKMLEALPAEQVAALQTSLGADLFHGTFGPGTVVVAPSRVHCG